MNFNKRGLIDLLKHFNDNDKEGNFTTQLTQNLIEIITVFYAKLYGRRSSKNRIKAGATLTNK